MKKRFLALTLALILLFALVPQTFAALPDGGTATVFKFSNNTDEPFRIAVEGGYLSFYDLPKDKSFDYLRISLEDSNEKETSVLWIERSKWNSAAYSLSGLANGLYYVQLYTSSDPSSTYWSYIYGRSLTIRVTNGTAVFPLSPAYPVNTALDKKKRTDISALDYYLLPSENIQSNDPSVIALAKNISSGITDDYAKIKAVHDWVAGNVWYDYDALYNGSYMWSDNSAVSTLSSRRNVCQGYANLTAALLRALSIPAKVVSGYTLAVGNGETWTEETLYYSDSNHVWNEAWAGGRWVALDATWDSDNEYQNKTFSTGTGLYTNRYFDPTPEAFSSDHLYEEIPENDIPDTNQPVTWSSASVKEAIALNLVPEELQGRYARIITRAEFCALAVRLIESVNGTPITARKSFRDTTDINVEKLAGLGVVSGRSDGLFDPDGLFSRVEVAVISVNLMEALGKTLPSSPPFFSDSKDIPDWGKDAVGKLQVSGIMSGIGNLEFSPYGQYDRQSAIMTIFKIYERVM